MKVLLVGSTGFIGKQIYFEMLKYNWQVSELNRTFANGSGFFDMDAVRELFTHERYDCVISTAWKTSHKTYKDSKDNFSFQSATENLALEVSRFKIPVFIALGSSAEYGSKNLQANCIDSELQAVDAYSLSKINTFTSLSEIFRNSQTRFIWPRIFQPYGHGQDPKRFIPYLISCVDSKTLPEISNPTHIYDWINVSDVANAIIFAITNDVRGAIDVGTGIGTSNIEVAESVLRIMGSIANISTSSSSNEEYGLVMAKKSILFNYGWKPAMDLNSGIRNLIDLKS